ncbi:MFS transporter [Pseudomonas sp. Pseu.R1]|uniref:MFS transporter n=1 Tax=Pseudomonas sp. Pseu.R1 TaxID=3379818 RepID=UPI003B93A346
MSIKNQSAAGSFSEHPAALSRSHLLLMATAAGVGIANLYYNQPLLNQMTQDLESDPVSIGLVPSLTQAGYAIGMLLLVPLGDMIARRKLVILAAALATAMLLGTAFSSGAHAVLVFSVLLGLFNMTPQLLIPLAAQLAAPDKRGQAVGVMLSGAFAGVLLSRTVAGFVGSEWGWRYLYIGAAALQAMLLVALYRALPENQPSYSGRYVDLLKTIMYLLRDQPVLREACLFGATLFGAFMVFWSSLIHLMSAAPFNLGPNSVGLYGILGAGAALLSPIAGRIADRGYARRFAGLMVMLTILSFGIFWEWKTSLIGIGVGVLAMDLGVQLAHVANQSRILHLAPHAQSRIQTAYMTAYFGGGGIGAATGTLAWRSSGWAGVCIAAILLLCIPLLRWFLPLKNAK